MDNEQTNDDRNQELFTKALDIFHTAYYTGYNRECAVWNQTSWLGVPVHKTPFDLWTYQEILYEQRPEVIVETGVCHGGSVFFIASICHLLGIGQVIGVDIQLTDIAKKVGELFPTMKLIEGSSTAPEVIEEVTALIKGRKTLVILDSDHEKNHVLQEMRLYNKFVPNGGYMIVEDSNVNGHPVMEDFGPGPYEAIEQFLKENNDFEIDKKREKFYMTFNPNGYLKRTKGGAGPDPIR